jgi:hypothetical protein
MIILKQKRWSGKKLRFCVIFISSSNEENYTCNCATGTLDFDVVPIKIGKSVISQIKLPDSLLIKTMYCINFMVT